MYFNSPETFEGTLYNFNYIPHQINSKKIKEITMIFLLLINLQKI